MKPTESRSNLPEDLSTGASLGNMSLMLSGVVLLEGLHEWAGRFVLEHIGEIIGVRI